jgi:AcrR family transcriptional regulator
MSEPDPRRQQRSLRTERRLAEAVIGVLSDGGLDRCTVPAVAQRAGVAVGTVYRRYADKDAMVGAAILDLVSLGEGAREQDYAAIADQASDLGDFLRRIAETAVVIACEQRTLLMAIRAFARNSPDKDWRARFDALVGRGRETVVRAAMRRFGSEIRGGEPRLRLSLAALYGAVDAVWLEPQAGLFVEAPSREEFIDGFVEMQSMFLSPA